MAKNNSKFADKKISSKQAEETKGGLEQISDSTADDLGSGGTQHFNWCPCSNPLRITGPKGYTHYACPGSSPYDPNISILQECNPRG